MSWEPFGGSEVPPCDLERAAFVLLPVPYDKTTTYRKGTAEGPRAILKASSQVELFDEECHLDPTERGVFTAEPLTTDAMPDVLAEQLETEVRRLLDRGKIVGCLGGEHSISLGPIRAAARAHPGLGLLQIDAHPDLRDEYEGTRFGHGCVMRRALETQEVACLVGVGWRSVSEEDHIAMGEQRIHGHFAHDLWRRSPREWIEEVLAPLPERVYVTLDVDGLDPSIVPGTGTPLLDREVLPGSIENGDPRGVWSFHFFPDRHNAADGKTLFKGSSHRLDVPAGRSGTEGILDAENAIERILDHPSTALFISSKLIQRFAGENIVQGHGTVHHRRTTISVRLLWCTVFFYWNITRC